MIQNEDWMIIPIPEKNVNSSPSKNDPKPKNTINTPTIIKIILIININFIAKPPF
jgi:hypothetical protein